MLGCKGLRTVEEGEWSKVTEVSFQSLIKKVTRAIEM